MYSGERELGLVYTGFLVGCFISTVYVDYCFPALLPSIYSFFSPHLHREEAGIPWSVVFPAPRDAICFVVYCVVTIMVVVPGSRHRRPWRRASSISSQLSELCIAGASRPRSSHVPSVHDLQAPTNRPSAISQSHHQM